MNSILVLAAATQALYTAQVATFGCNSTQEVQELLEARSNQTTFQQLLIQQIAYGQCVAINPGTTVEAAPEDGQDTILRVYQRLDPPGYMAPIGDFKLAEADKDATKDATEPKKDAAEPKDAAEKQPGAEATGQKTEEEKK